MRKQRDMYIILTLTRYYQLKYFLRIALKTQTFNTN